MKATELIEHLNKLIIEHWDLPLVWIGNDSDDWEYSINEFIFEKSYLVKENGQYRYNSSYKDEQITPVFYINI
jgi:hypothetical protein